MPSITYTCDLDAPKPVQQPPEPRKAEEPKPANAPTANFFQTLDWSGTEARQNAEAPAKSPDNESDANLLGLSPPPTPGSGAPPSATQLTPPTERKTTQPDDTRDEFDLLGLSSGTSDAPPPAQPADRPPTNFDILSGSSNFAPHSESGAAQPAASGVDLMGGMTGSSDLAFDPFSKFSAPPAPPTKPREPAVSAAQSEFVSFDPFGSSKSNGYAADSSTAAGHSRQNFTKPANQQTGNGQASARPAEKSDPFAGKSFAK